VTKNPCGHKGDIRLLKAIGKSHPAYNKLKHLSNVIVFPITPRDPPQNDRSKDDKSKDDRSQDDQSKDDKSKDYRSQDDQSKDDRSQDDQSKDDKSKDYRSQDDQSKDDRSQDDQSKEKKKDDQPDDRPQQHKMSGGDLDGDVYMAIWDEKIIDDVLKKKKTDGFPDAAENDEEALKERHTQVIGETSGP